MMKFKFKRAQYIYVLLALCAIFLCTLFILMQSGLNEKSSYDNENENNNIGYNTAEQNIDHVNVNELFHFGRCLLEQAGQKIVEIRSKNQLNSKNKEKDQSIVTEADLLSHQIIVHSLQSKYSKLKVISEESSTNNDLVNVQYYVDLCNNYKKSSNDLHYPLSHVNVWIDPLDATQEYSENLIEYVRVMFCITLDGKPKAGIVYNPFTKHTDWSIKNINNLKVDTNNSQLPLKPRIITSRSHSGTVKKFIADNFNDSEILIAGGSGYKSMKVANNEADLYLHTTKIYKWDICAPNAIINSMGGKMTDISGKETNYSDEESKSVNGLITAVYNFDYYLKKIVNKSIT